LLEKFLNKKTNILLGRKMNEDAKGVFGKFLRAINESLDKKCENILEKAMENYERIDRRIERIKNSK
jgi:hypothetical protein